MENKYIIADRIDLALDYTEIFEIYGYAKNQKEAIKICEDHWHEFYKNEPKFYEIEEFKKALLYNYIFNYTYKNLKLPEIQEIEKITQKIKEKHGFEYTEKEKNKKFKKIYEDWETKSGYFKYRYFYEYYEGHKSQRSNKIIYKRSFAIEETEYWRYEE